MSSKHRVSVSTQVDDLLCGPYWVIDLLPTQVPSGEAGQFFEVERFLLSGSRHTELRKRFSEVLLKLNCYHDLLVVRGTRSKGTLNPKPAKLDKLVLANEEDLSIIILPEEALLTVSRDSTCMTLYSPNPALLQQMRHLAAASNLFVWKPPHAE